MQLAQRIPTLVVTFVVLIALPASAIAAGVPGTVQSDFGPAITNDVALTIDPFKVYDNAAYVANGVALRNCTEGWIHLRGVPIGSGVKAAYLYWNFANTKVIGTSYSRATFNGHKVTGHKVADSVDACWGNVGNHTYRADVKRYLPYGRPNGNHEVVLEFSWLTSTTGQNPWAPMESQQIRSNGATLVVIYESESGQVFLYDSLDGTEFSGTATFTLNHLGAGAGPGLLTMSGADGQRGGGHDNGVSNETTFFNSVQIAGPPIAASDWDGSTGWPMTQLYDVHTHQVQVEGGVSSLVYNAAGDCLVPAMFVLQTP